MNESFPFYESRSFGKLSGNTDLLPKSTFQTPLLVTGHSGQSLDWIAQHSDGWLYYPRNLAVLQKSMNDWSSALQQTANGWKPYMQSLYIDLVKESSFTPTPIHLGFKSSPEYLLDYLRQIRSIGVNHVILNLKFSTLPIPETLRLLEQRVLPQLTHTT